MENIQEINIYGDITDIKVNNIINNLDNSDAVLLRINSEGGDVMSTFNLISALNNSNKTIYAVNEGFAISCGAILLASAKYSFAYPYSVALIHNPFYAGQEEPDELLLKVKDALMSILCKKMNKSVDEVSELMNRETAFNASEQLQYGLVNSILDDTDEVIDLSFSNEKELKMKFNSYKIKNSKIKIMNSKIANELEELEKKEGSDQQIIPDATPDMTAVGVNAGEDASLSAEEQLPEEKDKEIPANEDDKEVKNEDIDKDALIEELKAQIAELTKQLEETKSAQNSIVKCEENEEKDEVKNEELTEVEELKVENYCLKHSIQDKGNISSAVKKYGVDVLNYLVVDNSAKDELMRIAKDAANEIKNIKTDAKEDDTVIANRIFDINGDEVERIRIKNSDPELYQKLMNVYFMKEK